MGEVAGRVAGRPDNLPRGPYEHPDDGPSRGWGNPTQLLGELALPDKSRLDVDGVSTWTGQVDPIAEPGSN
jgi:hypothetical protein